MGGLTIQPRAGLSVAPAEDSSASNIQLQPDARVVLGWSRPDAPSRPFLFLNTPKMP